jgi:FxsC-like protein
MTIREARGTYFFLSYAHSPPTTEGVSDTDHWVTAFFHDLCEAVKAHAASDTGWDIGFYDDLLPPGSNWKARLADALSAAQVFVPLYSPAYLSRSWPLKERESFRRRLVAAGPVETDHIVPVLWTPTPSAESRPELEDALLLGTDVPAYAANGLRALRMLGSYREQYDVIRRRLARRIVETAERSPLRPSRAPSLDDIIESRYGETSFVVAILAATADDPPPDHPPDAYARTAEGWRPFAGAEAVPAAEHAANVAERLGLPTRVVDFASGGGLLDRHPGLLLIDPWTLTDAGGRIALTAAADRLREWVTPVVLADQNDARLGERATKLADEVGDMLRRAGVHRVRRAREVEEFVQLLPSMVSDARRQYLRNAELIVPPKGPHVGRPRLVDRDAPTFVENWEERR